MGEHELQFVRHRAVELARSIIDCEIGIIEGARKMAGLRFSLKAENEWKDLQ